MSVFLLYQIQVVTTETKHTQQKIHRKIHHRPAHTVWLTGDPSEVQRRRRSILAISTEFHWCHQENFRISNLTAGNPINHNWRKKDLSPIQGNCGLTTQNTQPSKNSVCNTYNYTSSENNGTDMCSDAPNASAGVGLQASCPALTDPTRSYKGQHDTKWSNQTRLPFLPHSPGSCSFLWG